MSILELPDEIWRKILEMGVKNSKLGFKDLCCVSISMESQIFVHSTKLKQLRSQLTEETQRLNSATAYVALNVWQTDIVRGSQKQVVEQCTVPIESQIRSLEMEHKLCKQQIAVFKKAYGDEKKRLDTAKKQLEAMKYHPIRDFKLAERIVSQNVQPWKKLKTTSSESSFSVLFQSML
ncbi:hypothetical protein MKW94_008691 [Papaver nudicaule]|uniref:F-box protein n=1 Tax=Papaver nudicaule TaxID=74823 RepID=A0AA41V270_PAPNU|nr:hypothetical protein [Papaver nudicaule]